MFDYGVFQDTATDLIGEFGRSMALVKVTDGAPSDPAKPWLPGAAVEASHTVSAVFTDYTISERESELIKDGDKKCLISSQDLTVEIGAKDIIRDGGDDWNIVNVNEISPGPTSILWKLQARKG